MGFLILMMGGAGKLYLPKFWEGQEMNGELTIVKKGKECGLKSNFFFFIYFIFNQNRPLKLS